MLGQTIEIISSVFEIVGIAFIIFGAVIALWKVLKIELTRVKRKFFQYEHIKRELIQKLIFGLDFLIAGDIIKTVLVPGWEELGKLGTIVIIRPF